MARKVTEQDAIRILKKLEKWAQIRGQMTKVIYEESTSYANYGRYPASSVEAAIEMAKNFVIQNNHRGNSARVLVTLYGMEKDGWLSQKTIDVQSPFNGKRNHLGYALPDENRLDEADFSEWGF